MDILRFIDEILPSSSYCFCHQLWNPRSLSGHLSGSRCMSCRQAEAELMTPPVGDIPQGTFQCALFDSLITSQDFQTEEALISSTLDSSPAFSRVRLIYCGTFACLVHPLFLSGDYAINCYGTEEVLLLPPWLQCSDPVLSRVCTTGHSAF